MVFNKNNYKYELKKVDPNTLNVNAPFYELFDINSDETYTKEFSYFGHYDKPVVVLGDGELVVLSNKEEVLAAINLRRSGTVMDIEVLQIEGLHQDDIPRFIIHRAWYRKKGYKNQFHILKWVKYHLKNNERGQQWANEIEGDMKKKLATILGVSETTIQNLEEIGNSDPQLFLDLDSKEAKLTEVLKQVKGKKLTEQEKNNDIANERKSNSAAPEAEPVKPPQDVIKGHEEDEEDAPDNQSQPLDEPTDEIESEEKAINGTLSNLSFTIQEFGDWGADLEEGRVQGWIDNYVKKDFLYSTVNSDTTTSHVYETEDKIGRVEIILTSINHFFS